MLPSSRHEGKQGVTIPSTDYDLLIVGGDLAGATLGRSMAQEGFHVLILEKELKFRDRTRGGGSVALGQCLSTKSG